MDDEQDETPQFSRKVVVLGSLIILFAGTAVALLLGEGLVRVFAPQQLVTVQPGIWRAVDSLGWAHELSADTEVNTGERTVRFLTDREGFRVGQSGRQVARDSILLIGDSFMAALQVEYEQSLPGLIEDSLRIGEERRVAVRNAGVGAWDPPHYLIFGRSRLTEHSYGLLLVSVYVGNDVVGAAPTYIPPRRPVERPRFRVPRNLSASEWIGGVASPINDLLERRSHLFVFIKNRTEALRIRLGLSANFIPRTIREDYADSPDWDVTADLLASLAEVAGASGTPALFALIPSHYQVDDEAFRSHAAAFGLDDAPMDLDQPNVRLRDELEERGLAVVDLLPAFRQAAASGEVLYGTVDTHFSPAGHRRMYSTLEPHIRRMMREGAPAVPSDGSVDAATSGS